MKFQKSLAAFHVIYSFLRTLEKEAEQATAWLNINHMITNMDKFQATVPRSCLYEKNHPT